MEIQKQKYKLSSPRLFAQVSSFFAPVEQLSAKLVPTFDFLRECTCVHLLQLLKFYRYKSSSRVRVVVVATEGSRKAVRVTFTFSPVRGYYQSVRGLLINQCQTPRYHFNWFQSDFGTITTVLDCLIFRANLT